MASIAANSPPDCERCGGDANPGERSQICKLLKNIVFFWCSAPRLGCRRAEKRALWPSARKGGLKSLYGQGKQRERFSSAGCRGLIEAAHRKVGMMFGLSFSSAGCRGLIEAAKAVEQFKTDGGFPRQDAEASLKQQKYRSEADEVLTFSSAGCRGLIEAANPLRLVKAAPSFPRQDAEASLKRVVGVGAGQRVRVFLGRMPRPH